MSSRYNNINVEDFANWAHENIEEYYELYDDHLKETVVEEHNDLDADQFLVYCDKDIEEANELFQEYLFPIIEELEQDDYFGTEGFDRRFG